MKDMGSSEDPDLTQVQTIDNKTQQCLQQCDLQTENLTTTSSSYPSRETFAMTKEFCYVLQKVARICKEPYRKEVLQQKVALPDCCKQIFELNNTLKVCNDKDHPDITIVDFKPELVDFLFNYASKNVVILKLFVKDPYYTKYLRTEKISSISFIASHFLCPNLHHWIILKRRNEYGFTLTLRGAFRIGIGGQLFGPKATTHFI